MRNEINMADGQFQRKIPENIDLILKSNPHKIDSIY